MGETGAVSFGFDHVGAIEYPLDVASEDDMFEAALEAGANEVESDDDTHMLYVDNDSLHEVAKQMEEKFGEPSSAKLIWKPQNNIELDDEKGEKMFKMLEALEDQDDVQNIYANFEVSDSLMEKLGS